MSDQPPHAVVAPSEYERNKAAIASYRQYLDSYEHMNEQGLRNHEDLERMEKVLEEKVRLGDEARRALEVLRRSKAALRLPNQIAPASESSRTPMAPVVIPSIQPTIAPTSTSAYIEELPNHDQRSSVAAYSPFVANSSAPQRQSYQSAAAQSHQQYQAIQQHQHQQYMNALPQQQYLNQAQQQQYQTNRVLQQQQQQLMNMWSQQPQYQTTQRHRQVQQQQQPTPDYYTSQTLVQDTFEKGPFPQPPALQLQQHISSGVDSTTVSQPGPSNQSGQGMSMNVRSEQSRTQQQQHQRNEIQRNAAAINVANNQAHEPNKSLQNPLPAQNVRPKDQSEVASRAGYASHMMQQQLQVWNSLTEAQKTKVMSNVIRDKSIPGNVSTVNDKGRVEPSMDGAVPRPTGAQTSTSGSSTSVIPQIPSFQSIAVINKPSEPPSHLGTTSAIKNTQPSTLSSSTTTIPQTHSVHRTVSQTSNTDSPSTRTPKQASKTRLAHDILRALKRPRTEDTSSAAEPEPKRHVSNNAIPVPILSTIPSTTSLHTSTTQNLTLQHNTQQQQQQQHTFKTHPQTPINLQPTLPQSVSQSLPQPQQNSAIQAALKPFDLRAISHAGSEYTPYSVPSRPASRVGLDPPKQQVPGQATTSASINAQVSESSRTVPIVPIGNTIVAAIRSQAASGSSTGTTPAASSSPETVMLDSVDQEMEVDQGNPIVDDGPRPNAKATPKKIYADPTKPLFLSPLSSPERQSVPSRKDKGKANEASTSFDIPKTKTPKMVFECVLVPSPPPYLKKWKAQQKRKGKAIDGLDNIEKSDDDSGSESGSGSGSDARMRTPLFLPGSRSRSPSASEFMNSGMNRGYEDEDEALEDMNVMDSSFGAVDETERKVILEHCSGLKKSFCRWKDCEVILNCPEALLKHIHVAHRPERVSDEFPWICKWANCGCTLVSGRELRRHIERHAIYPLYCHYINCSETFRQIRQLVKHILDVHKSNNSGVLRPTAHPIPVSSQSLEAALPPVPKTLPSYMTEYRIVRPASINKTRHESIMPLFLKEISGNVPVQPQRYNAAQPMPMTPSTKLMARMNTPYSFLQLGTAKYSSWPSLPAKLKNVQDINSGYVTKLFDKGLVLWSELGSKEAVSDEDHYRLDELIKADRERDGEDEEEGEEEEKVLQGEEGIDVFGPMVDTGINRNPGYKTAEENRNSQIGAVGGSGVTRRESSTGDEETTVEMMLTT